MFFATKYIFFTFCSVRQFYILIGVYTKCINKINTMFWFVGTHIIYVVIIFTLKMKSFVF